jgi:hypothetical protein
MLPVFSRKYMCKYRVPCAKLRAVTNWLIFSEKLFHKHGSKSQPFRYVGWKGRKVREMWTLNEICNRRNESVT